MKIISLKDADPSFKDVFRTFTANSTLHGISFLGTSRSLEARMLWLLIIISVLALSIIGIDQCVKGWESNPVITAVWQVPIESAPFPSITICPLEEER